MLSKGGREFARCKAWMVEKAELILRAPPPSPASGTNCEATRNKAEFIEESRGDAGLLEFSMKFGLKKF